MDFASDWKLLGAVLTLVVIVGTVMATLDLIVVAALYRGRRSGTEA
jgi:hypothetical protein